jgi:hypothetical protein
MSDNLVKCSDSYILPQNVERAELSCWALLNQDMNQIDTEIKMTALTNNSYFQSAMPLADKN